MDRTIKGLVHDYLEQHDLKSKGDATDLEKFSNYCVFYPYQAYDKFNINNVHIGGTKDDSGLDGMGIIIHGTLLDVENEDELDEKVERENKLDITFIFTQIKGESEFKREDILDTFEAINDFFSNKPIRKRRPQVQKKAKLTLHLLNKWNKKIRERPKCIIYYITNARKLPSEPIQDLIKKKQSELKDKAECRFERVELFPWGCNELERVYRRTILQVETKVTSTTILVDLVEKKETPITIQGVNKAIIGNLRFSEFKKIIIDDEGNIRPFIFYDNIRGFLGEENQVNHQIRETLESDKRNRFAILNNGVTIIAREATPQSSYEVRITDYQIVNGCQTSYVLYHWYKDVSDKAALNLDEIVIPVKIIETDDYDDEVRNAIIRATNSQTEVQKELLSALSEFPKKLEEFYKYQSSISNIQDKLYYERRPGQYNGSDIKSRFIIKVGDQIKTFAAMFLDLPHQARYKQSLIEKIPGEIFWEKHKPIPYYTSSLASYKLEELARQKSLPLENSKHIHYHVLMVLKYVVGGSLCPSCKSKDIEDYCQIIIKLLNSGNCLDSLIKAKAIVIQKAIEFNGSSKIDYANFFKGRDFTEYLVKELEASNRNIQSLKQEKQMKQNYTNSTQEDQIPVIRVPRKNQEDIPPLFKLLPEQEPKPESYQSDNYVDIPEVLQQNQLAKRLDVDRSTINRHHLRPDFAEWARKNDPDKIAWRFDKQTKLYYPLNE
ncbi:MAG: AIPR family protein [Cyanobacteriota bacterium]